MKKRKLTAYLYHEDDLGPGICEVDNFADLEYGCLSKVHQDSLRTFYCYSREEAMNIFVGLIFQWQP